MTLTTRYPLFSFTASDAAASRERFALAIASLCAFAAVRSSPPVIGSAFATLPVLWSTMTSENLSPFIVYTDNWSFPCSTSYLAEIGLPSFVLAVSPRWSEIFPSRSALASSACSASSDFCAQPIGTVNIHITRNASVNAVFFMSCSPSLWLMVALGLPLQHRVQTVEDRHAALEQVVIVLRSLGEAFDGQIDPGGLVARELSVVQVRLVHDLGDDLGAAILDPEALDQRLEGAVLTVMSELCAEHVERDALARGIGGVGEGKFRVGIVEAPDEPRRGNPINVRPRPRHPCAAARRQRRPMATGRRVRACLHTAKAFSRRLP